MDTSGDIGRVGDNEPSKSKEATLTTISNAGERILWASILISCHGQESSGELGVRELGL